jgi:two-component system response regulator YesN
MIKVLVVEDEISICTLIINLINWIPGELVLVGTAANGVEGFDRIVELQPDLVITDIRMPGISGLELIEKVKASNLDPMFIIISGHKEFDYARNAIKFGVEDYLLKPIKRDELNNALSKIINKHKTHLSQINQQADIHTQLTQSIQTIRHDRLFKYFYLSDHNTPRREAILKDGHEFSFQEGHFRILLVCADLIDPSLAEDSQSNFALEKLCDSISNLMASLTYECEYALQGTTASFVMNYRPNGHLISKVQMELTEMILNHEYKYDCLKFCLAMGEEVDQLNDLGRSTLTAKYAIEHRLGNPDVSLIKYEDLAPLGKAVEHHLNEKEKGEFVRCITALNAPAMKLWLSSYFQSDYSDDPVNRYLLYFECDQLVSLLRQTLTTSGLVEADPADLADQQIKQKQRSTRDKNQLIDYTSHYIEAQIEAISHSKDQQEIQPIKFCKQYISEHYMEQITLDHIARELYLNPVYLGSLFKSKTGISFTNWLLSVRIEKAKELLKTTRHSIYEVAELVGYSDAKHFSRLFFKIEGIKPIEYRKLYS